ncbi:hypothetical protein ACD661_03320 [Legionella lytica]|uniref:Substrate of the Dot/Icm secretion system n=1 Tax=Legionella lytica TaxID=96232 RepID=A0ABW8D8D4_9GAMM
MQAKQEATSSTNQEQGDFVPIFMMKLPSYPELEPINGYEQFFRGKVVGSWLIRESRVPGMISVTFKKEIAKTSHLRFAFINDKWVIVNDNMRDNHTGGASTLNYEPLDRRTVKSKYNLLLEAINSTKLVFDADHMIIPAAEEATRQRAYYVDVPSYVVAKQRGKEALFVNLLNSLDEVKGKIKVCIETLGTEGALKDKKMDCLGNTQLTYNKLELSHTLRNVSKPFKSNKDALEFKELFDTWLEENSFTFDLMCPVLRTLFVEPYYVVETGMVYDAGALFYEDARMRLTRLEKCPLTQTKITYNPAHLDGYRTALYETLELFYDLVRLYQIKTGLIKEQQDDFSNLPLLSVFAPSTQSDQHEEKEVLDTVPSATL